MSVCVFVPKSVCVRVRMCARGHVHVRACAVRYVLPTRMGIYVCVLELVCACACVCNGCTGAVSGCACTCVRCMRRLLRKSVYAVIPQGRCSMWSINLQRTLARAPRVMPPYLLPTHPSSIASNTIYCCDRKERNTGSPLVLSSRACRAIRTSRTSRNAFDGAATGNCIGCA